MVLTKASRVLLFPNQRLYGSRIAFTRLLKRGSLACCKRKGGVLTLDATEVNQLSGLKISGTSNPASWVCEDSEPCPRRRPGTPAAPNPRRPAKT